MGLVGGAAAARIDREVAAAYNAEIEQLMTNNAIFREMEAPSWLADIPRCVSCK